MPKAFSSFNKKKLINLEFLFILSKQTPLAIFLIVENVLLNLISGDLYVSYVIAFRHADM